MTKRDSQIQNDMLAGLAWEPSIDAAAISVELNGGIVTEAPAVTDVQTEGWVRMIRGGDRVLIRPLHSQDAEMERRFIEALSPVARRFRFLETMKTPSEELLKQLTVLDPATDAAFVAVMVTGSREDPIGVGRFSTDLDGNDCEFAVTVADKWQQKGLGTLLMEHLVATARARGLQTMYSSDAWDNELMRRFAAHIGLRHERDPEDATQVRYSLDLNPLEAPVDIAAKRWVPH